MNRTLCGTLVAAFLAVTCCFAAPASASLSVSQIYAPPGAYNPFSRSAAGWRMNHLLMKKSRHRVAKRTTYRKAKWHPKKRR